MTKEPQEEVGTLPETCKPTIPLGTYVVGIAGGGILEMLFDIAMTSLLGIQIRHMGWEPFHVEVRMSGHIVLDEDGAMCI